ISAPSPWLCVGKLIDGSLSSPIDNAHVVFDHNVIHYVGQNEPPQTLLQEQTEPNATLPNHTLLPGLIEGHAHLFLEGAELDFKKRKSYQSQSSETLQEHARNRLTKILQTGVVAMRDGGDNDYVGLNLKSERNGQAPNITSPGAAIYHQGRYGSFIGSPIEDHPTPEDCVAARIEDGADHIKVVPTGIINFKKGQVTKAPQMSAEEIRTFVIAAQKHNKHVMAHASGAEGIENAIQGGVNTIEHGFFVTSEQLAKMRDQHIAWVPTFVPVQIQVDEADKMGWSKKIVANLQKILDDHAIRLQEADKMGVTIIAGSDAGSCGVAHGLGLLYELELMEQAGLPSHKNVHAVTGASNAHFTFNEKIGFIKPEHKPRMILTQHDPTQTISNLKKEKWVIADGQWHHSPANMSSHEL
ncbi:MAG: amidohydrolase family protein, partial [Candidatus Latescibacteria bacterium]|nr:amidohydrolase family protein [Candidatus Latescibacterota bacterium]